MKKAGIFLGAMLLMISSSSLFADRAEDSFTFQKSENQTLSLMNYPFSLVKLRANDILSQLANIDSDETSIEESLSQRMNAAIAQFSLVANNISFFSLQRLAQTTLLPKNKKYYSKTVLEITGLNMVLWTFNHYVMKENWADISLKTILNNFTAGFEWDNDTYVTNQLGHPYHGALFHTLARSNGFNFYESTLYTALGSYMWEVALESIHPSANDMITTTFGGITFGEALYRMAEVMSQKTSTGFEGVLQKSLIFLINPVYGFKVLTGTAPKFENSNGKPYYALSFPLGAYRSSTTGTSFVIATNMEYKDFLRNDVPEISPYDWFTLNARFGLQDKGFNDKEIFTTGVIAGKKFRNNLAGLFGVFDYISTQTAEKMSALGLGPGFVTTFVSDSNFYINSSSVLSVIFGASSPSIDLEEYHTYKKDNAPYFLGPGMLGRINFELGRDGFGSISTGLSKYWVHCLTTQANEFLLISSLNIRYDLTSVSQISLEYDYYLRNGTLQEQRASGDNYTLRALYVVKF